MDKKLAQAMEAQDEIGWDHFMLGRLSVRWNDILDSEGSQQLPQIQRIKLVTKIFQTITTI